jgi:hypothetical protein
LRAGGSDRCCTCCTLVSCSADFLPWRRRWYSPPERRFTFDYTALYFRRW